MLGRSRRGDRVDVAPLRDAFLRSGIPKQELARRLGWLRPDGKRAGERLGLLGHQWPDGTKHYAKTIEYATAVEIAKALNVDPVDVGL